MLHIVNKSPLDRPALDTCLATAQPGGAILLIEDGVYAATTGNSAAVKLTKAPRSPYTSPTPPPRGCARHWSLHEEASLIFP